jgi:hypothetical protein
MQTLSEKDVRDRLDSYTEPSVTDELYHFGEMLLRDVIERLSKADTKAGAIAAYAGGLITLLVSTSGIWAKNQSGSHLLLPITAIVALFLSAFFAVSSMTMKRAEWFSPNEWMKEECLETGERLRRYHVLTMWGASESLETLYQAKLSELRKAQWGTLIAWVLLTLAFFQVAAMRSTF